MSTDRMTRDPEADGRAMTRTYIGVLVLEAVVLAALWMFQRYFGG